MRSESKQEQPYQAHFDAIEELNYTVELYGAGSPEAQVARGRVERTRVDVIGAWRREQAAA